MCDEFRAVIPPGRSAPFHQGPVDATDGRRPWGEDCTHRSIWGSRPFWGHRAGTRDKFTAAKLLGIGKTISTTR